MNGIAHILVATDGSEYALKAAKMAGDLSRALNAKVTLLLVDSEDIVVPNTWGPGEFPMKKAYASMSVEEVRAMFEKHAHEHELPSTAASLGELSTTPKLVHRWGHAATEICEYAANHDVDLIVIGSHGRTGLKSVLLGSVSHAVANNAPCPVTIVR